ncbi:MAG: UvrD-helicase domain-containing protein [Phoenicibacter congonensis]|uniref:DNA 3'-5' helicase n=1 Tax=Phoenicibacter congonensis TaxID=1944646 RepID=A0AA43U5D6_9ACTN|nr:UvrD-helicase domain-containing protein [Phoenicibacter congonensis]
MAERNPQLDVIETLDCPVIVQAGAGSGKTHTLTERIVYALTPRDGREAFARSVKNVVAITFTNKGAEEIKSRLRYKLEAAGLHDEALLVDDAFITTIHGFAGRILLENALAFGLNPRFKLINETEEEVVFKRAFDKALSNVLSGADIVENLMSNAQFLQGFSDAGDFPSDDLPFDLTDKHELEIKINNDFKKALTSMIASELGSQIVGALFEDGLLNDDFLKNDLVEVVQQIVQTASQIPNGDFSKAFVGTFMSPVEIVGKLCRIVVDAQTSISLDMTKSRDASLSDALEDYLEKLHQFLNETHTDSTRSDDFKVVLDLFEEVPKITPKFHINGSDRDAVETYACEVCKLALELYCSANEETTTFVARLSKKTFEFMQEELGDDKLTLNDVLRICYESLSGNEEIAEHYREKFDLIMIDEFQDTDNLQLELIGLVAKDNFKNVCTVGDVQQSIYRFRGADVNVFRNYKEHLSSLDCGLIVFNLPNNYRSHSDILALTDIIFPQENMFGDEFLHLNPRGKINDVDDPVFKEFPRVKIGVLSYNHNAKDISERFTSQEALAQQAKEAALHFRELADAGVSPGKMAVLLGSISTKSAEIGQAYQQALTEVGLESVITGGSTFGKCNEALVVEALISFARNLFDSEALAFILRNDFFNISDDALLVLASQFSAETGDFERKTDLSKGFTRIDEVRLKHLSEQDAQSVKFASEVLMSYLDNVRRWGLRLAIREFLTVTGTLDSLSKLGPEGQVVAGNYEKALAIIADLEKETRELFLIHEEYKGFLQNSKESPGILSTSDSQFIQIMTVHASKGLEFDHVVCAVLSDGLLVGQKSPEMKPICDYTSLDMMDRQLLISFPKKWGKKSHVGEMMDSFKPFEQKLLSHQSMTAGELRRNLVYREKHESLDEAKRLLYVALTRAVKSVYLQVKIDGKVDDGYQGKGLWEYLYETFKWDVKSISSREAIELPNGNKGILEYEHMPEALNLEDEEEDEEELSESSEDESLNEDDYVIYPVRDYPKPLNTIYAPLKDESFFSYSSIEKFKHHEYLMESPKKIELQEDDIDGHKLDRVDGDKATEFGTKLHGALEYSVINGARPENIDEVSDARLNAALSNVLESSIFNSVLECDQVSPELEFCVPFEAEGGKRWLRGAMDLVGFDGKKAHIIDYKSGVNPIDHESQAKVYSWVLLTAGYEHIEVDFLHAEVTDDAGDDCFVQHFSFDAADASNLKREIELAL